MLGDQNAANAPVQTVKGRPSHVIDVLDGPAALAPSPQTTLANAMMADVHDAGQY